MPRELSLCFLMGNILLQKRKRENWQSSCSWMQWHLTVYGFHLLSGRSIPIMHQWKRLQEQQRYILTFAITLTLQFKDSSVYVIVYNLFHFVDKKLPMVDACNDKRPMVFTILNKTDVYSPKSADNPDRYPNDQHCTWKFLLVDGFTIQFKIEEGGQIEKE